MSNRKISELPRAIVVQPSDQLAIVNQGVTKSITVSDLVGNDTGWLNIILKTNYPLPDTSRTPQYRVIGSTVYLRGDLYIPSQGQTNSSFNTNIDVPSNIHVDENFVYATESGALFFKTNANNSYVNLPSIAQPDKVLSFPNLLLSRRYYARSAMSNDYVLFAIPIVANVTFEINENGVFNVFAIKDTEDVTTGNAVTGAHPFRLTSTKINAGQPFPNFSHVSVGDANNAQAMKLDTFKKSGDSALLATEDIDTTKSEHLGGFHICLDGITYLNDGSNRWDYFYNRS
jgi:hypothetical protein